MTHIITESEVEDGVVPFTYGALQTDTGWRAVKNDSVATRAAQALGKRVVEVMELLRIEK